MHVYRIGYSSWEESPYVVLLHEQQFSEMELAELVAEAIDAVLQLWIATPPSWEEGQVEDHVLPGTSRAARLSDVYHPAAAWLVKHRGFRPISYDAVCVFPGWDGLAPGIENGWSTSEGDHPVNIKVRARVTPLVPKINEKHDAIDQLILDMSEPENDDDH
jgi:hypothetical protein